jgi:hypothetical protein
MEAALLKKLSHNKHPTDDVVIACETQGNIACCKRFILFIFPVKVIV